MTWKPETVTTHKHEWQKVELNKFGAIFFLNRCECGLERAYDMKVVDRSMFQGKSEYESKSHKS